MIPSAEGEDLIEFRDEPLIIMLCHYNKITQAGKHSMSNRAGEPFQLVVDSLTRSYVDAMTFPNAVFASTRRAMLRRNVPSSASAEAMRRYMEQFSIVPRADMAVSLPPRTFVSACNDSWALANGKCSYVKKLKIRVNIPKIAQAAVDGGMGSVRVLELYGRDGDSVQPILRALRMGAWPRLQSLHTGVDNGLLEAFLSRDGSRHLSCFGRAAGRDVAIMSQCTRLHKVEFIDGRGGVVVRAISTNVMYALRSLTFPFDGLTEPDVVELSKKIESNMPKLRYLVLHGWIGDLCKFKMSPVAHGLRRLLPRRVKAYVGDVHVRVTPL